MEILSKITMRTIVGGEVKALLGDKDFIDFAQVYGFATKEEKGDKPTQFGDNIWIAGEFKAKNLLNGNSFYAPKLYAPEILHNILCAQLAGESNPKVQFAMIVGIKKSKAVIGYEYCVKSLIEPKEDNNPFAAIENQLSRTLPPPNSPVQQGPIKPNLNPGGASDPSDINFTNA